MTREERAYNYATKKNPSKFTVGEIAKHYDDGYADGQKDTVDKACVFINQLCDGFSIKDNMIGLSYTKEELLKDFKKAMEE